MSTTARGTLAALYGTVSTTASAITTTAGTIAAAVSMAGSFIDRKVEEQAFYSELAGSTAQERIIEELAVETMERKIALVEVTGKTTAHTSLYEAAHANLKAKADAWNAARKKSSIG